MAYKVDNAIIMCAGTSSRFAPISFEKHKALIEVKGEILIERQIKQLKKAGIEEIILVLGYKKSDFYYLKDKYNVTLIENTFYDTRNNNYSIYVAKDYLKNSYICSADNYFVDNPFENFVDFSYYSAVFESGETKEWCIKFDEDKIINNVHIGGKNEWVMLGHTFWDQNFSSKFISILENIYDKPETFNKLWESIYIDNLSELKMKIRFYDKNNIYEFDTLDELRNFDEKYYTKSYSKILKEITTKLNCQEKELSLFLSINDNKSNEAIGFSFVFNKELYKYIYLTKKLSRQNINW